MKPLVRPELWVVGAAFLLVTAAVAHSARDVTAPGTGAEDVDVVVVDSTDPVPGLPVGTGPQGRVDVAEVDSATFHFAGWADFRDGAYFVLLTDGTSAGRLLRGRSVARGDVAAFLRDHSNLYTGFDFSGSVAESGMPACLLVVGDDGSRPVWKRSATACR